MTNEDAVVALSTVDESDPDCAHSTADEILLALVAPEVAAAYRELADERCAWWAFA